MWLQHAQRIDTNKHQNKHYNIDQKDEGILDDRRRDGGNNSTLRINLLKPNDIYIYIYVVTQR